MKHLSLIASVLAVLGLTACEKGLGVEEDGMFSDIGQVKNSLLHERAVWLTMNGRWHIP